MFTSVSLIEGLHITATEKKAVLAIVNQGLTEGRVGRTDYHVSNEGDNTFNVTIVKKVRGIGLGAKLRIDKNKITVKLK